MSMGGHQSAAAISTTWLTPQPIIDALGGWQSFDLDPCAAPAPRPWFTAWQHNAEADGDGLALDWFGRVWLNFPYDDPATWLQKMVDHGQGTALIFARTETDPFHRYVWERALLLHRREPPACSKCRGRYIVLCWSNRTANALYVVTSERLSWITAIPPLPFAGCCAIYVT